MGATKYTYSISGDFPNQAVAPDRLEQEVRESSIVTALDFITSGGNDCDIWFKDALSSGDEDVLDSIVAIHSGEHLENIEVPHYTDGKPKMVPDRFIEGMQTNWAGCDDDITNGVRLGGNRLVAKLSSSGESTRDIRYLEYLHLAGGESYCFAGAAIDDWLSFSIHAPATVGDSNPGAGAYDKVAIGGGINVYVPNATAEGDWDLDLTETYNANVSFTKVVPVPAINNDGYFDHNPAVPGVVTLNASGEGGYNLFDAEITLSRKITKYPIVPSRVSNFIDTTIATKPFFPQWLARVTIYNSDDKALDMAWVMYTARYDLS